MCAASHTAAQSAAQAAAQIAAETVASLRGCDARPDQDVVTPPNGVAAMSDGHKAVYQGMLGVEEAYRPAVDAGARAGRQQPPRGVSKVVWQALQKAMEEVAPPEGSRHGQDQPA